MLLCRHTRRGPGLIQCQGGSIRNMRMEAPTIENHRRYFWDRLYIGQCCLKNGQATNATVIWLGRGCVFLIGVMPMVPATVGMLLNTRTLPLVVQWHMQPGKQNKQGQIKSRQDGSYQGHRGFEHSGQAP